jgi:two-component system alkaline phosphatase synthesis response regulator PhoP
VHELLISNGYSIEFANDSNHALQKLRKHKHNLVICNEKLSETCGYNVYRFLKEELINLALPFFLILKNYQKEDIMIALEMGIDNLIFFPLNKEATLRKIKNELTRKQRYNILNTYDFLYYFHQSHTPMMLIESNKISTVNHSLSRLNNHFFANIILQPIEEILDLTSDQSNTLNIKRFKNQLTNIS